MFDPYNDFFINKFKLRFYMSSNPKVRRRISFTPIMLSKIGKQVASKSIRPVDRSDYEILRNERKFSGVKKARDDLTHLLFRNSNQFGRNTTYDRGVQNQVREEQRIGEDVEQENFKQLVRKTTTPTVVKMEFQNEVNKQRQKLQMRILKEDIQIRQSTPQKNRFVYFTNAKTFDQFTKMAKLKPPKKHFQEVREETDEQWKKYLDKYYLNIHKVRPLMKRANDILLLSPRKVNRVESICDKVNDDQMGKSQILARFHSNAQIYSLSKRDGYKKRDLRISPNEKEAQQLKEQFYSNSNYKKIEQDIATNKGGCHKKDYFVFGLSENNANSPQGVLKAKFDNYKDFIFRINFTNGLYVKYREENDKTLKFFVGFGNNSAIVKGIMRRRFWWQMTDKMSDEVNFSWTQLKISDIFKKQKRNQFRLKHQKQKSSFDENGSGVQDNSHKQELSQAIMCGQDMRLWEKYMSKNCKFEEKGFDYGISKRVNGLLKKKPITLIQNSIRLKMHNHLQCNYFLGNKKALFYSLKKYYQLLKINPFTKIPLTFHITQGLEDPEFQRFLQEFENQKKTKNKDFRNIWIIKPGELTNRGRGITVCSTLDQIKIRLKTKQRNSNGTNRTFILQKYIQKPLLYHRRKFDIRHYMMITCHNGRMKGYWYLEGYIRTTSSQYNIKNTKDLMTHLTNDAVQKNGQDYGKFQKGNKVSYTQFQKYLANHVSANIDFHQQILPKMKQLATDSIRATYSILDSERKEHNFELFGLDFMLDQALNVYIIEVNTNPCLETSCPLLTKIITPLVQNVFKIGLDPLFPPPFDWPNQKKYLLGDNAVEQNKFTLVFDELQQGSQLKQLYKNTPRIDDKMGDIFEEQEQYQDEQKQWNDEEQQPKKQK